MKPLDFELPIAELEEELDKLKGKAQTQDIDMSEEVFAMEKKLSETRDRIYDNLSPWQRVQIARHTNRRLCSITSPTSLMIFVSFMEIATLVMITRCQVVSQDWEIRGLL